MMLYRILSVVAAVALYAALPFTYELRVGGGALAAEGQAAPAGGAPAQETRRVPAMSEPVYKKLTEAQEALEAKNYQQALTLLNDPTFVEAARALGERLLDERHGSDAQRLRRAFALVPEAVDDRVGAGVFRGRSGSIEIFRQIKTAMWG